MLYVKAQSEGTHPDKWHSLVADHQPSIVCHTCSLASLGCIYMPQVYLLSALVPPVIVMLDGAGLTPAGRVSTTCAAHTAAGAAVGSDLN